MQSRLDFSYIKETPQITSSHTMPIHVSPVNWKKNSHVKKIKVSPMEYKRQKMDFYVNILGIYCFLKKEKYKKTRSNPNPTFEFEYDELLLWQYESILHNLSIQFLPNKLNNRISNKIVELEKYNNIYICKISMDPRLGRCPRPYYTKDADSCYYCVAKPNQETYQLSFKEFVLDDFGNPTMCDVLVLACKSCKKKLDDLFNIQNNSFKFLKKKICNIDLLFKFSKEKKICNIDLPFDYD
jgi:hypothetical protein